MAQPPPRRSVVNSSCKTTCHRATAPSALHILQQMGFPKARAEKALAATGYRGPQLAADWLLAHVNDSTLDDYTPREYILYLCPSGSLKEDIEVFYSKSLERCSWNGAHNYLPHITLCSFFQAPDECAEILTSALVHCVEKMGADFPRELHLTPHISQNFIGLFVNEDENDMLKRFAMLFMRECGEFVGSDTGALHVISTCFPWCSSYPILNPRKVEVEPYLKSLHITLSYQYAERDRDYLASLIKEINLGAKCSWELRLYSRDSRIKGNEVYRVLYPHVPREPDELELLIDDYVYVNGELLKSSIDGWTEGISWLTGCHGMLPINYIERTAESNAWTLHKCITIGFSDEDQLSSQISIPSPDLISMNRLKKRFPMADANSVGSVTSINISREEGQLMSSKLHDVSKDGRRLIVVRHGERMDFTFPEWVRTNFQDGKYVPSDLNHPKVLPKREPPTLYNNDTSLTAIGGYQAFLVGEAIKEAGIQINHVYSSPALRCVQTCTNILKGLGIVEKVKINIEPGIFEYMGWYVTKTVEWIAPKELADFGFPINLDYKPLFNAADINGAYKVEDLKMYYERSHKTTEKILNSTDENVLFVGHGSSIDASIRQMSGAPLPNDHTFHNFLKLVPYCSSSMLQRNVSTGKWECVKLPFTGISHCRNLQWDWDKAFHFLELPE